MGAHASKKATEKFKSKLDSDKQELKWQRQQLHRLQLASMDRTIILRPSLHPGGSTLCSENDKVANLDDTGKCSGSSRNNQSSRTSCDFSVVAASAAARDRVDPTAFGKDNLQVRPIRQDVDKKEHKEEFPHKGCCETDHCDYRIGVLVSQRETNEEIYIRQYPSCFKLHTQLIYFTSWLQCNLVATQSVT